MFRLACYATKASAASASAPQRAVPPPAPVRPPARKEPERLRRAVRFEHMALDARLLRAAHDLGFARPTLVQQFAIAPAVRGGASNVVASAESGSGKTAAYLLPVLHRLLAEGERAERTAPRALILTASNVLVDQVCRDVSDLAQHAPRGAIRVLGLSGNHKLKQQVDKLAQGTDVLVATPGRLMDLLRRSNSSSQKPQSKKAAKELHSPIRIESVFGENLDFDAVAQESKTSDAENDDVLQGIADEHDAPLPAEDVPNASAANIDAVKENIFLDIETPSIVTADAAAEAEANAGAAAISLVDEPEQTNEISADNPPLVSLKDVRYLVIDECDKLLSPLILPQVMEIWKHTPRPRDAPVQTFIYSATILPEYNDFIMRLAPKHVLVNLSDRIRVPSKITQTAYKVRSLRKIYLLRHLLDNDAAMRDGKVVVFARTIRRIERIVQCLAPHCAVQGFHMEQTPQKRRQVLDAFRAGEYRVLVTTNLLNRGVDMPDVTHIVNYDLPQQPEEYIHRAGRTGTVISFVPEEIEVSRMYKTPVWRDDLATFDKIRHFLKDKGRFQTDVLDVSPVPHGWESRLKKIEARLADPARRANPKKIFQQCDHGLKIFESKQRDVLAVDEDAPLAQRRNISDQFQAFADKIAARLGDSERALRDGGAVVDAEALFAHARVKRYDEYFARRDDGALKSAGFAPQEEAGGGRKGKPRQAKKNIVMLGHHRNAVAAISMQMLKKRMPKRKVEAAEETGSDARQVAA